MTTVSERLATLPVEKRKLLLKRLAQSRPSDTLPPIVRQPRDGKPFPLSYAQERMWFNHQWAPDSPLYNEVMVMHITGPLQVKTLEQNMTEIVRRHEILRTSFQQQNGKLVQVVMPPEPVNIHWIALAEVNAAERENIIQAEIDGEAQQPFELDQLPLFRMRLLQLGTDDFGLIFVIHHIIFDGWSVGVLLSELSSFHEAYNAQQPSPPVEPVLQYGDYAVWQRTAAQQEPHASHLTYWEEQLADAPSYLDLPVDRPRPSIQRNWGETLSFALPKSLARALQELSRQQNATLFMTLLTAFKVLLYRYSGQEDLVVGTPVANRTRRELEGMLGVFTNTLALRTQLTEQSSFLDLLAQVRRTTLDSFDHQELPFELLVKKLQPARDLSRTPIIQVMFDLQKAPVFPAKSVELLIKFEKVHTHTAKFDLSLLMIESETGLGGAIEYNTDLYERMTIERMIGHFQSLLTTIVVNPTASIASLPLLTEPERVQLLVIWNQTEFAFPEATGRCMHHLVEAQAERNPAAVAVIFENQQLSYRVLNQRANQLGRYLQAIGIGPGSIVGICLERSIEMIVGVLAVQKAGGAYLPLKSDYPQKRINFICQDANLALILTQQHLVDLVASASVPCFCLDTKWSMVAAQNPQNIEADTSPDNLAYIIYTSGSTGLPKGVMLAHRGLCNMVEANRRWFDVQPESNMLQFSSFVFDGWVYEVFVALTAGATLCMGTQTSVQPGPELSHFMQRLAITHAILPPAVLAVTPNESLPTLKALISSGESCSIQVMERWGQGRRFINGYGPTENTVCTTLHECKLDGMKPPIGRPLANCQIYLLDKQLQPVPIGIPGELYIGGANLAQGYLNRPELTAERFIPNPFRNKLGDRLYRSGDLARYLPNGDIEFIGRVDNQVKIRGFRIELGEIEATLLTHPHIQENVVLVRETEMSRIRLVAYIVPVLGQGITESEVHSYLADKLPEYMVPNAYIFLADFPLTTSGKIDHRALPVPDLFDRSTIESYTAPRDVVEELLAEIWGHCLVIKQPGIHDNFFQLGGHSLLVTQVLVQIDEIFHVQLPVKVFFESPTISDLAQTLRQHEKQPGQIDTIAKIRKQVSRMSPADIQKKLQRSSA